MKKILLVEDNEEVRENTSEILQLSGYKVFTAENGKLGMLLAIKEKVDLIICDIMMPVLDGYGLLHMLHKNKETATIPFIFITAKSEKADFRKGMEMGADDFLTKPFDGIELLNAVEGRLKKTELIKQGLAKDAESTTAFFDNVNESGHLSLISTEREVYDYKKKHQLYSEGQRPGFVYHILSGKVKIYKTSDTGKELITNIYGAGEFIGHVPMLEETAYRENAKVLENARIMLIPKKDFTELIHRDSQIANQFIRLLTHNVTESEEKLMALAYNSLRKRVANGILEVVAKLNMDENKASSVSISRENLANIIGAATESLIRTLSDFKDEKLIDLKEGRIYILNEKKLKNIVN